jgi:hypothetical protein
VLDLGTSPSVSSRKRQVVATCEVTPSCRNSRHGQFAIFYFRHQSRYARGWSGPSVVSSTPTNFYKKKILFSNVPKLLSSSTSISNNNNNSDSLQFLNFETFRWYPPLHSFGLVPSRYFFLTVPLSDVLRYHHCHDLFSFSNFFIQVSLLLHFLLHIWGVLLEDGTGTTALDLCSSPTFVGKLHV